VSGLRGFVGWSAVGAVTLLPLIAAATSPLLAWRDPVYIAAGFAGIFALALLLVQPLAAAGVLPGLTRRRARLAHRSIGAALVLAVAAHVAGLWITSPPDVIDVLLFASPTPFGIWGVLAMWAVIASVLLAALRTRIRLRPRTWTIAHRGLAAMIVTGSIVHTLLIEGTMEPVTKILLCICAGLAALVVLIGTRRPFQGR